MSSKRSRFEALAQTATAPPAQLASEVFDTLLQCSRKQLAQLVSVFVKASSVQTLELVRAAAVKNGALVETKSRFQKCNREILDLCFSFLDLASLRTVEAVCARWRYVCLDGGAGFSTALSKRSDCDLFWTSELSRHRIDPARLTRMQTVRVFSDAVAMASQLPNVTSLDATQLVAADFARMAALASVQRLLIWQPLLSVLPSMVMAQAISQLFVSPELKEPDVKLLLTLPKLTETALDASPQFPLRTLCQSATLRKLRLQGREFPPDAFATLSALSSLEKLELTSSSLNDPTCRLNSLDGIERMMSLRDLRLPRLRFPDDAKDSLSPLSNMTDLTVLYLMPVEPEPEFDECRFLSKVQTNAALLVSVSFTADKSDGALWIPL